MYHVFIESVSMHERIVSDTQSSLVISRTAKILSERILSFIELKQPSLADLCRLRTRIKAVNFVRIVEGYGMVWYGIVGFNVPIDTL